MVCSSVEANVEAALIKYDQAANCLSGAFFESRLNRLANQETGWRQTPLTSPTDPVVKPSSRSL